MKLLARGEHKVTEKELLALIATADTRHSTGISGWRRMKELNKN